MSKVEFTEEELEYLRANYGRVSVRSIARRFYVSSCVVERVAQSIGLPKQVPPPAVPPPVGRGKGKRWSDSERQALLAMIDSGNTWAEIAAALGRTINAVRSYKSSHYPGYPAPKHSTVKGHTNYKKARKGDTHGQ